MLEAVRRLGEAVNQLKRLSFACVLLDLGLPDGKGLRNIEEVRAADPNAAIIVLTGLESATSALKAVEMGAQDYLVKGHYDEAQLLTLIRRAIRNKTAPAPGGASSPTPAPG